MNSTTSDTRDLLKIIQGEVIKKYSSLDINNFEYYKIAPENYDDKPNKRGFKSIHNPKSRKMGKYISNKPHLTKFEKEVLEKCSQEKEKPVWISDL